MGHSPVAPPPPSFAIIKYMGSCRDHWLRSHQLLAVGDI